MKRLTIFLILYITCNSIFAQNKIPEIITTDLVLKPTAKPYESTGFVVEKGASLTILPGTKINNSPGKETKGYCYIVINGTLNIGAKGATKSNPVVFEGICPWISFNSAKIEINGWNVTAARYQFHGDNSGTIRNVNFYRDPRGIPYTFNLTVPTTANLLITDCLIEDQGIDINTKNFPNDLDKLTITKCAFTTRIDGKKLRRHYMPITIFAYGTKCDSYIEIEFKAFDWPLKKALINEWYISDARTRKTTEESAKSLKSFSLKLPAKPITNYKQEELPPVKEEKK